AIATGAILFDADFASTCISMLEGMGCATQTPGACAQALTGTIGMGSACDAGVAECAGDLRCLAGSAGATCEPLGSAGASCDPQPNAIGMPQCQTGLACLPDAECGAPLADGQTCITDGECVSGFCNPALQGPQLCAEPPPPSGDAECF